MLTIFSIPKSFIGHTGIIQRNAIQSWLSLKPKPEVILFGNDEGTAETAARFGARHIAEVACNEYGTPLLNSIFNKAQDTAKYQIMCYVNADIILMGDFLPIIRQIKLPAFLLVGQRCDADLKDPVDFNSPDWEERLRLYLAEAGKLRGRSGLDYFIFPRGLYRDLPPFAIGRTSWDHWLAFRAGALKAAVIDATEVITAVHQNHDYSHHPAGEAGVWKGPESEINRELSGGGEEGFTLEYATRVLTPQGLRRILTMRSFYFRLRALPMLHQSLRFLARPMKALTSLLVNIRSRSGINRK